MDRTENNGAAAEGWIGSLTYKSTATATPSAGDLDVLVGEARARNRRLGVTGMLLFEDGSFLQTLEGSPDNLDVVWASIKRDPRHEHIELLSEHIAPTRLFGAWDLLFHSRLNPVSPLDALPRVLPHNTGPAPEAVASYVNSLARLALAADDLAINAFIAGLAGQGWTSNAIVTLLIEPTARALGDAWLRDDCSGFDLTIGISMLQLAGHAVRYNAGAQPLHTRRYSILLATAPGETHGLGTSLLADQFTDAGWRVDMAFPDSDEALANQLRAQSPDAVDIGLSDALPRHHALMRLRATVEHSRLVDPGHPAVISVGGRLFAEAAATAVSVGADHARMTAAGASIRMAELVRQSRARQSAAGSVPEQT